MKCNKCGFENPDSAKFCNWCGEKLDGIPNSDAPKAEEQGPKTCQICGTVNEADAKYCAVCGSQLSSVVQKTEVVSQSPSVNVYVTDNKFATASMVIGIISLIASLTCCLFVLSLIGGVVAIVFGIIALKKDPSNTGKPLAGIICGAIGAIIGFIMLISVIVAMNDPEFLKELEKIMQESGGYY